VYVKRRMMDDDDEGEGGEGEGSVAKKKGELGDKKAGIISFVTLLKCLEHGMVVLTMVVCVLDDGNVEGREGFFGRLCLL
jgi:hypothetical protein